MEIVPNFDQADLPPSLTTLPLEIRFKIFKPLLINPVLGALESILANYLVQARDNGGIKYHLHPAILTICRQNCEEGCKILYSQPFFLYYNRQSLNMGYPDDDKHRLNPLLRYGASYRKKGMDCKEIKEIPQPAFKKIIRPEWELSMFKYFCGLVFGAPIRGLEFILRNLAEPEFGEELMESRQTFLPLTIFRNVGDLTTREAALDEFPPPRRSSSFAQGDSKLLLACLEKSNLLDKKSYKKLKRLSEGNRPVERADIVEHVQPQYNHIVDAFRVLVAAIGKEKGRGRALDPDPLGGSLQTFEAARLIILLEKYAAAFERDQDSMTEIAFRVDKTKITSFRMDHPREMMLRRLGRAFEHERLDLFIDTFQELLYDLQVQFSEVKQTWRDLFKSDTHGNTMCHTEHDSDSGSLNGMIDLTVR